MTMETARIALAGLAAGIGFSLVKYFCTRRLETKPPNGFLLASAIRQAFNLVVLLLAGLVGNLLKAALLPLLVGAALGLTIPTVALAVRNRKSKAANPTNSDPNTAASVRHRE